MTLIDMWISGLENSFSVISNGLVGFVPNLIVAVIVFLAGTLIADWVGRLVTQVVRKLKIDEALRSANVETVLNRGGITLDTGKFIGAVVKWYIVIVFLVAFLDVVGLDQINDYLKNVVLGYLPRVIVAAAAVLAAAVIGNVMQKIVAGSARAARLVSANFLGSLAKWSILIFGFMVALVQLGVASAFIQALFTGIVAALSIAFGLSFGLGGQAAAADFIARFRKEISDHGSH